MNNYRELAQRTSATITPDLVARIKDTGALTMLASLLAEQKLLSDKFDTWKRSVFYNKPSATIPPTSLAEAGDASMLIKHDEQIKLIHGIVGMISECGELGEQLGNWLFFGGELQVFGKDGMVEEFGDFRWYQTEALEALKVSDDEVETLNIQKLAARYGERYSDFAAVNRDVEKEHEALGGSR